MSQKEQLLCIGYVKRTSGFKGMVQIALQKEVVLKKRDFFFLSINGHQIPFQILDLKGSPSEPLLMLSFVEDVDQAKEILGSEIWIESNEQFVPEEYAIIGYTLVDRSIGTIGLVTDCIKMPSQLMLMVDHHNEMKMIPFVEDWIDGIFPEYKELAMNLPEGILDL